MKLPYCKEKWIEKIYFISILLSLMIYLRGEDKITNLILWEDQNQRGTCLVQLRWYWRIIDLWVFGGRWFFHLPLHGSSGVNQDFFCEPTGANDTFWREFVRHSLTTFKTHKHVHITNSRAGTQTHRKTHPYKNKHI